MRNSLLHYFLLIACAMCVGTPVLAQTSAFLDKEFCEPNVYGLPRPKGLEISHEIMPDYGISPGDGGDAAPGMNERTQIKLKFPLLNRPGIKVAAGLQYTTEEISFRDEFMLTSNLNRSLADRGLKTFQSEIYVIKPTRSKRFYFTRFNIGFNGDYQLDPYRATRFMRFSLAQVIAWKQNRSTSFGFGAAYNYSFGSHNFFPVLIFNKSFSEQWGIESILPVKLSLRYTSLNQRNIVFLKANLSGDQYPLHLDELRPGLSYLDKSELRFTLAYEREIHDWLWFGLEAGYRTNLSFNLSSSDPTPEVLYRNRIDDSMLFGVSLFIVAPRKWIER